MRVVLVLAVLAGCSADEQLEKIDGSWIVTTDEDSACEPGSWDPTQYPSSQWSRLDFGAFDGVGYHWLVCDAITNQCEPTWPVYFYKNVTEWHGEQAVGGSIPTPTGPPYMCWYRFWTGTAVAADGVLSLEITSYYTHEWPPNDDQSLCSANEAQRRATTLPCEKHVRVAAHR